MTLAPLTDVALIEEHNQEARTVWDSFHVGQPIRPPIMLCTGTQFFIFNDDLNPGESVCFETYCTDAKTMLDFQLRLAVWRAEHIAPFCDDPIGTPEEVSAETHSILESGVLEGGKFVLREANNLAPRTPFANLNAMYQTARSLA